MPALTGVILATNSEFVYTPTSGPNSGQLCVFFGTTTNAYEGRVSELTTGATTWASLRTANLLGSALDIVAPTATYMAVSGTLQRFIFVTNAAAMIAKEFVNNQIKHAFGSIINNVLEANPMETESFGLLSVAGLESRDGWILASSTTVGQRVIVAMDYRSDADFVYSQIISPVIDTGADAVKFVSTIEALFDLTGTVQFFYRIGGFGTVSASWVAFKTAEDLSIATLNGLIQFRILFDIANQDASTPAQIIDLTIDVESEMEVSDQWEYSRDKSETSVPSRSAFRLKKAYTATVPNMRFRAKTLADLLVENATTSINGSSFQYSTDGGSAWLSLGTVPNVVGTLLRYSFPSPPGVEVRVSLREA